MTPGRYSKRSGISSHSRSQRLQRAGRRRAARSSSSQARRSPAGPATAARTRRPRPGRSALRRLSHEPAGGAAGSEVTHPRAHVDRQLLVVGGNAELEHLGAEVVEVAADARLGLDARVELVAALRGGRRRAHAQRVEVVGHRPAVAVLGQVADREVHVAVTSLPRRALPRRRPAPSRRPRSSARRRPGRCARAPAGCARRSRSSSAPSGSARRWKSRSAARRLTRSTGLELRGPASAAVNTSCSESTHAATLSG